jgi:predicted outer membrane repeat protein
MHLYVLYTLGGALHTSKVAVATVSNSTCTGNTADRFAGAVFLSGGGTVSNVQFDNNGATSGGAIYTQVT